jgi:hypothetical protein
VDIRENQAAIAPQDFATQAFATQDFAGQGYAAQGFTTHDFAAQRAVPAGFTMEDVLWAAGIWSVILTLSPVIVFYMLMVA